MTLISSNEDYKSKIPQSTKTNNIRVKENLFERESELLTNIKFVFTGGGANDKEIIKIFDDKK